MSVQSNTTALLKRAEGCGHGTVSTEEAGLVDVITCACGWQSHPHYDEREIVQGQYLEHLIHEGVSDERAFVKPVTAFQQALAEAQSTMTAVRQAGERWRGRQG